MPETRSDRQGAARRRARAAAPGRQGWGPVLPRRFYARAAPEVAADLLGRILVSRVGGRVTAGRIVEVEAYLGPEDRASHAAFRPSSRPLFYGPGGVAYVYRAYGLHACLNAIAGARGTPGCVLIRALEPLAGVAVMARRRGRPDLARGRPAARALTALTSGPARLTEALGVTVRHSGRRLGRGVLTIHAGPGTAPQAIARGPRIGITRAVELPLRYWIRGNPFVSRPRRDPPRARPG
jgi:DNA-3-methyladenine glycosylase